MVRQARSILPRFNNERDTPLLTQEKDNFLKSCTLDPILIHQIEPSIFVVLLYPMIISLAIYGVVFLLSYAKYVMPLTLKGLGVLYLLILTYTVVCGYSYKLFLQKNNDANLLAYMYVCMYALTYLPVALMLSLLLGPIGSVIVLGLVFITQFYIPNCLLFAYEFSSAKRKFLFSILTFVLQFIFILIIEQYVYSAANRILK